MTFAGRYRHVAVPVALLGLPALAAAMMVALQQGSLRAGTLWGGAASGVLVCVAWGLWPARPRAAAMVGGAAIVPAALLALMSPTAGLAGIAIAGLLCAALRPLVTERNP